MIYGVYAIKDAKTTFMPANAVLFVAAIFFGGL
nr:MAG TPA: hypothetical protein [Microviridae sp.]